VQRAQIPGASVPVHVGRRMSQCYSTIVRRHEMIVIVIVVNDIELTSYTQYSHWDTQAL